MLSSLGGLLDAEGNWNPRPDGVDLEQWRHLASLGRDHYVRVVYTGFLCPFGHAASLIKVTERKFESLGADPAKQRVAGAAAALLHRRSRAGQSSTTAATTCSPAIHFPFRSVEILTRVTPSLMEPGTGKSKLAEVAGAIYDVVPSRGVFWPMVVRGATTSCSTSLPRDICGKRVTFAMPLLFVGETANDKRAERGTASLRRRRLCRVGATPASAGPPSASRQSRATPTPRETRGCRPRRSRSTRAP